MTDAKNGMNGPDELRDDTQTGGAEGQAPELEIEEVSWELEDSSAPAREQVPAAPDAAPLPPARDDTGPGWELDTGAAEKPPYAPSDAALDPFAGPVASEPEEASLEPEPAYAPEASAPEPEPVYEPEPAYEPGQEAAFPEVEAEAAAPAPEPEAAYDYTALWGWKQIGSSFAPFIFDSDKALRRFSPGRIDDVDDVSSMGSYFSYLADFTDAQGMGLLTLSTEMKYAGVLARKNLEEIGELSTDGVLKIFTKRKLEGGQISALYEVLPREHFVRINEAYRTFAKGFIIFDTVSLLYSIVKRLRGGVGAVALHLPGAILMLAGKGSQVYLARRYTLIGDDEQALTEGIFALEQDLAALQKNIGQRIAQVEWIEALTPTLNLARPEVEIPLVPWPVHMLPMGGERMWSALPTALRRASAREALGPKEELFLRPLESLEKFVWAAFLALAIVCGLFLYQVGGARQGLDSYIKALRQQNTLAEQDLRVSAVEAPFKDMGQALELAEEFNKAAVSPPFGEMWNYLASLRPSSIRVDALEFVYQSSDLGIRLEGEVEMELTKAQQIFNSYLVVLEKNGFKVDSQKLELGLEGNFYTLNIRWPLLKEGE